MKKKFRKSSIDLIVLGRFHIDDVMTESEMSCKLDLTELKIQEI